MSEQKRKTQSSTTQSESANDSLDTNELEQKGRRIGAELDTLLDEIDDVLEENAAEFVRDYVQHGGQ
jgi:ubiquitin-like protein Pup